MRQSVLLVPSRGDIQGSALKPTPARRNINIVCRIVYLSRIPIWHGWLRITLLLAIIVLPYILSSNRNFFPHHHLNSMTKRVHFATANASYSPIPPTPSPTHSMSSLPSLSAPPTPPPVNPAVVYPRTPFESKRSPLPSPPPDEMHIHFLLAYSPFGAPATQFDVSLHPSIQLEDQVSFEAFSEPATEPPLTHLRILCPNLLWPIDVIPSKRSVYVTVYDVFHALYHELRLSAHPTEYKKLPSLEATRDVDMAYYYRCGRSGDDEPRQRERGIKRVDFLMGRNRFLGLSGTLQGPDIWELNVS